MHITFHGAANAVTGSKHLLSLASGKKILFDCGMFQGMGAKTNSLNESFGFDPAAIDVLLLSHAHIDHSGLIPRLVKEGFKGQVFCTPATKELTAILLSDSAGIQEHEASHMKDKGRAATEPLYTTADVESSMKLFATVPYETPFSPIPGVSVQFFNAGHIIGSASVHLTVTENGKTTTLLFSGDVGRYRSTLLQSPSVFPQADYIIMESTYGNKLHDALVSSVEPLLKQINNTCFNKKGRLIIPAFSVGRTQEVLFALNQLELERRLPAVSYYVDSPMAHKATAVIKHHMEEFNDKLQEILKTDDDPFDFTGLEYVDSPEESKMLAEQTEPCVIISASGTADAGRVKHHLHGAVHNENNTILFVGHCQVESTGGRLLSGAKTIELFGEEMPVVAEIDSLTSMSAHGDSNDLLNFLACADPSTVKHIFLVHGDKEAQEYFAAKLERKGFMKVSSPQMHEGFVL